MITNNGKLQQLRVLAGKTPRFADYFVFGATTGVPGAPDLTEESKTLKVGWGVCPITGSYLDEKNNQIIFYATVPNTLAGLIGEIGLLSLDSEYIKQDKPATGAYFFEAGENWSFETDIEHVDGETGQVRLGSKSVLFDSTEPQRAILTDDIDTTMFDQLVIVGDTSAPITISLYSGENDYAVKTDIALNPLSETTLNLRDMEVHGEYDPAKVVAVVFDLPPGNHIIDGILFRDTKYGNLVAGSEVAEPFYKSAGSNLEIEYAVKLNGTN